MEHLIRACRKGLSVKFYKFNKLFADLKKAEHNRRIYRLLDQLARVDLFILNEFAFRKIDQQSSEWPRRCQIAERDR